MRYGYRELTSVRCWSWGITPMFSARRLVTAMIMSIKKNSSAPDMLYNAPSPCLRVPRTISSCSTASTHPSISRLSKRLNRDRASLQLCPKRHSRVPLVRVHQRPSDERFYFLSGRKMPYLLNKEMPLKRYKRAEDAHELPCVGFRNIQFVFDTIRHEEPQ